MQRSIAVDLRFIPLFCILRDPGDYLWIPDAFGLQKGIIHEQKETDFRKRLLSTFKVEAQEHLKTMTAGLVELEKTPPPDIQMEILETIYRGSHSLKGLPVQSICQISKQSVSLSKVYFRYGSRKDKPVAGTFRYPSPCTRYYSSHPLFTRRGQPALEKDRIPKLIQALSNLEAGAIEKGEILLPTEEQELRAKLSFITTPQSTFSKEGQRGVLKTPAYPLAKEHPASSETVRIPAAKLGSLLLQAEEMLAVKHIVNQYALNLKDIAMMIDLCKTEASKTRLDIFKEQRESTGKNGGTEKVWQHHRLPGFRNFSSGHKPTSSRWTVNSPQ